MQNNVDRNFMRNNFNPKNFHFCTKSQIRYTLLQTKQIGCAQNKHFTTSSRGVFTHSSQPIFEEFGLSSALFSTFLAYLAIINYKIVLVDLRGIPYF